MTGPFSFHFSGSLFCQTASAARWRLALPHTLRGPACFYWQKRARRKDSEALLRGDGVRKGGYVSYIMHLIYAGTASAWL